MPEVEIWRFCECAVRKYSKKIARGVARFPRDSAAFLYSIIYSTDSLSQHCRDSIRLLYYVYIFIHQNYNIRT